MSARAELLQELRSGLEQGFCLDWHADGMSRGWPGSALFSWAVRLRQHWHRRLLPRSRIAVNLPNSPAYITHWLAAWLGDWIFCPLPALPEAEERRRLELLAPVLILRWRAGKIEEQWNDEAPKQADPDDLASIYWSSASSGPGSAYGLTFSALRWQWQQHAEALGLGRQSLIRNTLPWSHVFAGVLELLPAVLAGAEIRVAPLTELRHEEFSQLCTIPRIAAWLNDAQLRRLASGIVGGAAIPASLAERLQGSRLRVGYGQTEAGPGVTLGEAGNFSAGYIGFPLSQVEVRVADTLQYRSPGQVYGRWDGELWETLTDAEGWVDSGDRVMANPAGDFAWLGRDDSTFKLANGESVIQPEREELRLQAIYPTLNELVLGAPGQRQLAVLAAAPLEEWRPLQWRWRERYPLFLLPPAQWESWRGVSGKTRRGELYAHWTEIVGQAWRIGGVRRWNTR